MEPINSQSQPKDIYFADALVTRKWRVVTEKIPQKSVSPALPYPVYAGFNSGLLKNYNNLPLMDNNLVAQI